VRLVVNGDPLDVADGIGLASLVAEVAASPKGVAVAVNGDLVPRSAWDETVLVPDDRVEILSAAQGG
jgi:sulfur carrier protein